MRVEDFVAGGTRVRARARAPLRLGLAGGGSDLSPYCDLYGGAVLNVTIDRFAYASLDIGAGETVLRASDMDHEERPPPGELELSGRLCLHRAVCRRMRRDFLGDDAPPVRVSTMVDAPPGSGLGSSSALVVALVEAFRVAFDLPLGRYDVARLAYEIERKDLGLAGGRQDQYAAAFGGMNFIEFLADDRVVVNPLRLRASVAREVEASIVVCFTGRSRDSHDIIVDQIRHAHEGGGEALENMHRLKAGALAMKTALLRGDLEAVNDVLNASWAAKKGTAASVSNAAIERLWAAAMAGGAQSGKVSGAGGGGFLMFLCDPDRRSDVMRALKAEGGDPDTVAFTHEGVEGWLVGEGR